jgi:hypothetical protein
MELRRPAGAVHQLHAQAIAEHGWATDEWPQIQERVFAADILVLAGPIWLGDNSSVMKRCIERLPSYLDPGSGGPENDFTNRNSTFMTWNLMHLARLLKSPGDFPAQGNQRSAWDIGQRFDWENPEYRF